MLEQVTFCSALRTDVTLQDGLVLPLVKTVRIKMKTIEVDEELYRYIASHTQHIGESASDILRRMLKFTAGQSAPVKTTRW